MHLPPPGADFEPAPAGSHLGICIAIVDSGTQLDHMYGKTRRQLRISWELPEERMKDDRPFTISAWYTLSTGKKSNFRKLLEGWAGRPLTEADFGPNGFKVQNLLGKAGILTITHDERDDGTIRAKVQGVSKMLKSMKEPPPPHNKLVFFGLSPEDWQDRDAAIASFENLSPREKEKIERSPEFALLMHGEVRKEPIEALDDDIPF